MADHGSGPEDDLSPREVEILRMIVKGLNDQEVADSLGVPPAVVEVHLQRIREKLGLNDPEPPLETA